jgi:hypothetical protein
MRILSVLAFALILSACTSGARQPPAPVHDPEIVPLTLEQEWEIRG